jgi:hypothetical protein
MGRVEPLVEGGGVGDAGLLASGDHRLRVLDRERHRLLAQNVLPGVSRCLDERTMQVVRGRHVHGVDTRLEELSRTGERPGSRRDPLEHLEGFGGRV